MQVSLVQQCWVILIKEMWSLIQLMVPSIGSMLPSCECSSCPYGIKVWMTVQHSSDITTCPYTSSCTQQLLITRYIKILIFSNLGGRDVGSQTWPPTCSVLSVVLDRVKSHLEPIVSQCTQAKMVNVLYAPIPHIITQTLHTLHWEDCFKLKQTRMLFFVLTWSQFQKTHFRHQFTNKQRTVFTSKDYVQLLNKTCLQRTMFCGSSLAPQYWAVNWLIQLLGSMYILNVWEFQMFVIRDQP